MEKFLKKRLLLIPSVALFLLVVSQASLWSQSFGGGLMYSSYLPLASLYNTLEVENGVTGSVTTTPSFKFGKNDISHYAPGVALSGAFAISGLLTTVDIGFMGGAGPNNIIPNFPIRPFIAFNAGYKFTPPGILGLYGLASLYFDFGLGEGKNNYKFTHFLGYFRAGAGVSLKVAVIEIFAQIQLGMGLQAELITLESKAGNTLYNGMFLMVPVALFPEIGIRIWG